jgi:hypothetical protein
MLALVPAVAAKAATMVSLLPAAVASVTLQVAVADPATRVTAPTEHAPVYRSPAAVRETTVAIYVSFLKKALRVIRI